MVPKFPMPLNNLGRPLLRFPRLQQCPVAQHLPPANHHHRHQPRPPRASRPSRIWTQSFNEDSALSLHPPLEHPTSPRGMSHTLCLSSYTSRTITLGCKRWAPMGAGLHPRSTILLVVLHAEPTGQRVVTGPESVRTIQNSNHPFSALDSS